MHSRAPQHAPHVLASCAPAAVAAVGLQRSEKAPATERVQQRLGQLHLQPRSLDEAAHFHTALRTSCRRATAAPLLRQRRYATQVEHGCEEDGAPCAQSTCTAQASSTWLRAPGARHPHARQTSKRYARHHRSDATFAAPSSQLPRPFPPRPPAPSSDGKVAPRACLPG